MGNKPSTPENPQVPSASQTQQVPLSQAPQTQPSHTAQRVEEKVQQAAKAVSAEAHKIEDKAKEAAHAVKETAKNVKDTVVKEAKESGEILKKDIHFVEDKAKEVADKAKEAVKDAKVSTGSVSGDIQAYLKEARRVTKSYYKEAKHEFDVINQEGPVAIANFKKNHIFPIDPTTRSIIFYGVTGLSFLFGIKGGLRAIRNTAVVGLATGFVVYPEAINPFYRLRKQYIEEQQEQYEQDHE